MAIAGLGFWIKPKSYKTLLPSLKSQMVSYLYFCIDLSAWLEAFVQVEKSTLTIAYAIAFFSVLLQSSPVD